METTGTKKKTLLVALMCTLALCLSMMLTGCGGSSSGGGSGEDYTKNFAGSWDLRSMGSEDGDVTLSAEDLEMMAEYDMAFTLSLNEDGTATLEMYGEDPSSGTWKADSATECSLTMEGETIKGTLSDDQLSLTQDGTSLVFVKAESQG